MKRDKICGKHCFYVVITHVLYRYAFETGLELDEEEPEVLLEAGIKPRLKQTIYVRDTQEKHAWQMQRCNRAKHLKLSRQCIVFE